MNDALVRGGTVVDGSGAPAFKADVRVRNGVIVEVGAQLRPDGEPQVDAGGAFVAPGFVDTHTHLDPTFFWDPFADPMPQHGITTVVTGNCSLSLAPIRTEQRPGMSDLFCYIEDMPASSFADGIAWSWETYDGYRDALNRDGLAVNAASLIGHTPLRLYVMGEEAWDRSATEAERATIAAVLDASMRAGAFGVSLTYFDMDASGRPVPARLADEAERAALIDVVAAHGGVLQVGPARPEELDRLVALADGRDMSMTWLGVNHGDATGHNAGLLAQALELQARGIQAFPQFSPRTGNVVVNWERTIAFMTFPRGWHRIIQSSWDDRRLLLEDPEWRAVARAEWDEVVGTIYPHKHPELVRIVSVTRPEHERWVGRTFADLLQERPGHASDVLADWVLDNDLTPGLLKVGGGDLDEIAGLLDHPAVVVGASDAGAHVGMICASGDSTLILARHVRDRGDLSLERAVWRLTGHAAQVFRIPDRGLVSEGRVADLVVFDLDELVWDDESFVDDLPSGASRLRRPEGGYRYTMVAGDVTQEDGKLTGRRPATVLMSANADQR